MRQFRRHLLAGVTLALAGVGLVFVLVPFVSSWQPNAATRHTHELAIPIRDLPGSGVLIVEWKGWDVFIVMPERKGFMFQRWNGEYYLPEPYSEKLVVSCNEVVLLADQFQCVDPSWREWNWAQETIRWNRDGSPGAPGLKPLPKAPIVEVGGNLILGRVDA